MICRRDGHGFVKTGALTAGAPVESRHWQEVVDDFDRTIEAAYDQETEEAVVEMFLEDPRSFMETTDSCQNRHVSSMIRRSQTGGNGLQRHNDPRQKTASVDDWDQDFAEARAHVASILSNLGNESRNFHYRPATPGKLKS